MTALSKSIAFALLMALEVVGQTTKPAAALPDPAMLGLFIDKFRVPVESGRPIVVPCAAQPGSTHRIELTQRSMQRYDGPLLSFDFERPLRFEESTRSDTHIISISYDPKIAIEWIESSPAEARSLMADRRALFESGEGGMKGVLTKAKRRIDGLDFEGTSIAVTEGKSSLECFEYIAVIGKRAIHLIYGYPTAVKATWGRTFEGLFESVRFGDRKALAALPVPAEHGEKRPHYDVRFDEAPSGTIASRPVMARCGHVSGRRHELWLSTTMPVIEEPEFFASEECSFSHDLELKVTRVPPNDGNATVRAVETVGFGESFRVDIYFWATCDVGDEYLDSEAVPAERRAIEAGRGKPVLPTPEQKKIGTFHLLGRSIPYDFHGELRELWISVLRRGEGGVYFRIDSVAKMSPGGRRAIERVLSSFRLPGDPGFGARPDAGPTSSPTK